jgi:hypothetical protein
MATTGSLELLERTLAQAGAIIARARPEQATLPTPLRLTLEPAGASLLGQGQAGEQLRVAGQQVGDGVTRPADDATAARGTG